MRWLSSFSTQLATTRGDRPSRGAPGAVITDAAAAAAQARRVLATGTVATLCVHGDTEGALAIARAVRDLIGPRR